MDYFEQLIAPVSTDTFFDEYWEKKPLHIARDDPGYYARIASPGEIDALIAAYSRRLGLGLTVIRSREAATRVEEYGAATPYDQEAVYRAFAAGATVRLKDLHRHLPGGQRLAADMTKHTSAEVGINMYLTPRESRAFDVHEDGHEVFIVQLQGTKHWRLYDDPTDLPNDYTVRGRMSLTAGPPSPAAYTRPRRETAGPPLAREVAVRQGDFLYVPRGHYHSAHTTDAYSLHFTVGAYPFTWHDAVVGALAEAFRSAPELRRALPVGLATGRHDAGRLSQEVVDAVSRSLDAESVRRAMDHIGERLVATTPTPLHGLIEDIERAHALCPDDRVGIRPHVLYRIQQKGERSMLSFNGRNVVFPLGADGLLDQLEGGEGVEISALCPALRPDIRLRFVRQLISLGFLAPVDIRAAGRREEAVVAA